MKRIPDWIKDRLHLSGRDSAVLLMSLLVAFVVWLGINLSQSYSGVVSVPVIASSDLEGHSPVSASPSVVTARCRMSGYSLLRNRYKGSRKAVRVTISRQDLHRRGEETYFIAGSALNNYSSVIFGDGTSVDAFISDTVVFRFPVVTHKKVPVSLLQDISFRPQYMATSKMKIEPDSVVLYGEQSRIVNVDRVYTAPLNLYDLHSSADGTLKLGRIKGVRMSPEEVRYSLSVSRYVELKSTVPVDVRGCPPGKKLQLYPSSVEVVFHCAFPVSRDPSKSLRLYVDYAEFASSINGRCIPRAMSLPAGVIDYKITPEVVDCILSE